MSKRRFDIYCEFNGLFGYDPPIDREKRLKELGIGISALRAIETAILYRICLNEEFRPYLGELFRKEVNSRGYYYERI